MRAVVWPKTMDVPEPVGGVVAVVVGSVIVWTSTPAGVYSSRKPWLPVLAVPARSTTTFWGLLNGAARAVNAARPRVRMNRTDSFVITIQLRLSVYLWPEHATQSTS